MKRSQTAEQASAALAEPPAELANHAQAESLEVRPRSMKIHDREYMRGTKACPQCGMVYDTFWCGPPPGENNPARRQGTQLNESPCHSFDSWMSQLGNIQDGTEPNAADLFDLDAAKLKNAFPFIAEQLLSLLKRPSSGTPEGLFDLGNVGVSYSILRNGISFRPFLSRHASGDFGGEGRLADALDSPEARFIPCLFGRTPRSVHAIRSGHGLVVSRYAIEIVDEEAKRRVESDASASYPQVYKPRPDDWIGIVTLLSGRRSQTVILSSRDSCGLP